MIEYLSAKQYSVRVGVHISYITKILKHSKTLPFIDEVVKHGNTWMITLSKDFDALAARNDLKNFKTK